MKTVFVTGASGGLGRGLALHYAKEGAKVFAAARRKDELEKLARESENVVPVGLDVQDTDALVNAIHAAGDLDLVIANAGIGHPTSARKIDWAWVKKIMDVNVTAACVTIAAALPAMVARNQGHVVAMSSLAAFRGMPGNGAYCASKAAIHTFMESIRVDLRRTGVKATTVYPGFVKTDMTAKNKFPMPFLMELDDAVSVIARGLKKGAKTIAFPLPLNAFTRTLGALPAAVYEPLAGRVRMF
ncbi:MAG: SDR family NAD(P)-dependent oxidoreductase [Myxococcales bacterium]|nr:SDR family NAD(P)-dependent oxidoreductase [Myxococcales bacterium]